MRANGAESGMALPACDVEAVRQLHAKGFQPALIAHHLGVDVARVTLVCMAADEDKRGASAPSGRGDGHAAGNGSNGESTPDISASQLQSLLERAYNIASTGETKESVDLLKWLVERNKPVAVRAKVHDGLTVARINETMNRAQAEFEELKKLYGTRPAIEVGTGDTAGLRDDREGAAVGGGEEVPEAAQPA